jgi:ABC-type transport system involved in cytochrome c biogenesis permease subunit
MKFPKPNAFWITPCLCILALLITAWYSNRTSSSLFNLRDFSALPIVSNGRVQPLDSLARNRLLAIQGKQRVPGEAAPKEPIGWLAELAFEPSKADKRPIFIIHHDEVRGLIKLNQDDGKAVSFERIAPHFAKMAPEAERIATKNSQTWSAYEKALMNLWNSLGLYQQLKFSFAHPEAKSLAGDLSILVQKAVEAKQELAKRDRGEEADEATIEAAAARSEVLRQWSVQTEIFTEPPGADDPITDWRKLPQSAQASSETGQLHPSTLAYARMGDAYRNNQTSEFNSALNDYLAWLGKNQPKKHSKTKAEALFNRLAPFYVCMVIYVVSFLCALVSWIASSKVFRIAGFQILLVGLLIHTTGLLTRMLLEGRPPVTNLYSSAIFIGWGTVILGVILELFHKNSIGTAVSCIVGFCTLLVAHHLSLSGDTLEMMRAVLDSNFWLATHVIIITLGYSATFLAGAIGIIYLFVRIFITVPKSINDSLRGMAYGIICFALFASFIGTVLGGIWADQSWGRFWGWDPKENGALLIVLWNGIILHARLGGMIREKGMMVMAVFGNIVTSWSWFGTNMLGIGLHSYGFTDAAFTWLLIFVGSQLLIMALAFVPARKAWQAPPLAN